MCHTGRFRANLAFSVGCDRSEGAYRIFEAEQVEDKDLYEYFRNKFHPDDLEKLDTAMKYAIENLKGYQYQHRIIANDGTVKHILGIGEVIINNKGELIGLKGSGQDITEIEDSLQSYVRFIGRVIQEYEALAKIFHFVTVDAEQSIADQHQLIRSLFSKSSRRPIDRQNREVLTAWLRSHPRVALQ